LTTTNYYVTLGVPFNADEAKIKKAYRNLALKYHPDKNMLDEKKSNDLLAKINEAYEVLSNKKKRAEYDKANAIDITKIVKHNDIFSAAFEGLI
jgi:curved DNA-binding protein CbpA